MCNKCGRELNNKGTCDHCNQNNKKNVVLILSLIAVMLLVFIVTMFYFEFRETKPNLVYNKAIDSAAKIFDLSIFKMNQGVEYTFEIDSDIDLKNNSINKAILHNTLNKLNLIIKTEYNLDKKTTNLNINPLYNDENIFNLNMHLKDNSIYCKLDSYNKYIKIGLLEEIYNNLFSGNYGRETLNLLTDIIKDSLNQNFFALSNEKVIINGKEEELNEYILNLKGNNLKYFLMNILYNTEKNDKILTFLKNYLQLDEEQIKESIDNIIDDIDSSKIDKKDGFVFHIYTKKQNDEFYSFSIEKRFNQKEESYKITFVEEGKYEFIYTDEEVETKYLIELTDNKTLHKVTFKLTNEDIEYKLTINRTSIVKTFTNPTIKEFININDITLLDIDEIVNNLMKNSGIKSFITNFK